eukprot:CAMPEP_0197876364 /NCGR_PEP_ID=MMETSP1439-20131203/5351_1 /TAXON_ID=66791 /ORGANISM="Gonyaulax spinifera, Strain CCMP409" /LENGTH=69 /DNA_ID=CAMNT_0043495639 /DNA_START=25 /DNA_END=230 /DNA_ORIENTATION=+
MKRDGSTALQAAPPRGKAAFLYAMLLRQGPGRARFKPMTGTSGAGICGLAPWPRRGGPATRLSMWRLEA